jgi:glycosyltransferase involved in cell wall biosynthesis
MDELRLWRAFARASRSAIFDLVEVIDWGVAPLLSILCVRHGPVLLKLHGPSDFIARLNGRKIRRTGRFIAWRERWIARHADVLLSADPALAHEIAQLWNLPSLPDTIPDPVHLADERIPKPRRNRKVFEILAVGKLERRKDQATLIRALGKLDDGETSWRATIVGPDTQTGPRGGSYKTFLLEQVPAGFRHRLRWIDQVPRDQLWSLYARSDAVVVCTVDGAYGYTTLDGMSAGVAVITTTPDGKTESPYVRHGETAWVYPAGDDVALAEALRSLSGDPGLRARLGIAARKYVDQELSPQCIAQKVLSRIDR